MVTMQILFGSINISFGWPDFDDKDIVIIVHPKWNLIFFARQDRSHGPQKVHVIHVYLLVW
jgi:hypothetical protein